MDDVALRSTLGWTVLRARHERNGPRLNSVRRRKLLEISPQEAQNTGMGRDHNTAPAYWVEELARADEDIAHGKTFPVTAVLDELRAELAGLEAEIETEADAPATDAPARRQVQELTAHYRKKRRPETVRNLITAVDRAAELIGSTPSFVPNGGVDDPDEPGHDELWVSN